MTTLLLSLALRLSVPGTSAPIDFTIAPQDTKNLRVILSGPAADLPAGPFKGVIALNGSASEMVVVGTVTHSGDHWQLPVSVAFAEVPADWADRFRPDGFSYRLRETGGAQREWTGSRTWKDVALEGGRDMYSEFGKLDGVSLTDVSLLSSEAQARATILNPFAFPLKIASTQYVLYAEGREIGSGQTQGMLLHPGQKNVLTLPIDVDHGALLAAAGGAVLSGGEVAVHLDGKLVLRLKGGDVAVPFALSGHLSGGS